MTQAQMKSLILEATLATMADFGVEDTIQNRLDILCGSQKRMMESDFSEAQLTAMKLVLLDQVRLAQRA